MGLDLSLQNTGVTILTRDGLVLRTLTLEYSFDRRSKKDPPVTESQRTERLIAITNDIVGMARDYGVRWACVEDYAHNQKWQAHRIGEIGGNVKVQLYLACNLVLEPISMGTARKLILGYGRPKKQDIVKAVNEGFNIDCANDHEADSVVTARTYFEFLQKQGEPV
jgi:Holliday junction resolvasome RuvABC endonuclease subunit